MAVMATVLTMSSTVVPRERSLTGLFRPCNTGPTATAPADCCTALYVLLPVLRSGKINTVACPATSDSGILEAATDAETAASYCSGPSTFSSGRLSRTSAVASRTLSTSAPLPDSPVERSEEHTSELQSRGHLVCRLLLEKTNNTIDKQQTNT